MKRTFWLAAGFGLGVAAAQRVRRRTTNAPTGSSRRGLTGWARAHVHEALEEGRQETRRCEAALRAVLAAPRNGPRDPGK